MTSSAPEATYPPLPSPSVIQIHDAAPDRLVLSIEPGKGAAGIGLFAIVWNLFMAVFTAMWITAFSQQKGRDGAIYFFLFIGVFWAIGFGFIYAWLKLKFERSLLLVERDRVVLRRVLFGRQRQTEVLLDESSRAQLTESYQQNDSPVYRVTVVGVGGNPLHFGTSLTPAEKDWVVDAINALLLPEPLIAPADSRANHSVCEACGVALPADAFRTDDGLVVCPACEHQQAPQSPRGAALFKEPDDAPLPEELPGVVTILENSPERLALELPLVEQARVRWGVAVFALIFSLFWYGISCGGVIAQMLHAPRHLAVPEVMELLFLVPFLAAGLTPIVLGVAAVRGRLTTAIDHDSVVVRVHVGPLGKSWQMKTEDITAVRVIDSSELPSRRSNPRLAGNNPRASGVTVSRAAALCAGSRRLVMTALHEPLTARFVVAVVRRWLQDHQGKTAI